MRVKQMRMVLSVAVTFEILFLMLLGGLAHAAVAPMPEGWTSARALGMGNAFTAVVSDADSLFYNPAGLAKNHYIGWTLFDPRVGLNGLDSISRMEDLTGANQSNFSSKLNGLYGHPISAQAGAMSAIVIPNFGAAAFANGNVDLNLQNPAYPNLNLNYFFDYGIAVGGAFDFIPEIVKLGVVVKQVNRTGTTETMGPTQIASLDPTTLKNELERRGVGYSMDVGIVTTFPSPVVKPSLSFVYKDVGTTSFAHTGGISAPSAIAPDMIVGGGLEISGPFITIRPAIDFTYMNIPGISLLDESHVGVEVELPLIDIRAGFNQGYYTLGAGVNLGLLHCDLATYGVELGTYPGQQEDRRYIAQVTIDFEFDASRFGYGGSGGKSGSSSDSSGDYGHLKQRR